jgi:pyridoxamine 5'-phosphate oxidase
VTRGLLEEEAGDDPIALFSAWFDEASRSGLLLPEAMTLATSTSDGRPAGRMVLLRGFDERGFVFYTNYGSRKAEELTVNPKAELVFHWPVFERQVRIAGRVEKTSAEESAAYFASRPRGSQLGAWASRQSQPVESREALEHAFEEQERKFAGTEVPLPSFWGGYRVVAHSLEFFQGRANRLHDRLLYTRDGAGWRRTRLYP